MTIKKTAQLTETEINKVLVPLMNFFRKNEEPCTNIECAEFDCQNCPLHDLYNHFTFLRDDVEKLAADNDLSMD